MYNVWLLEENEIVNVKQNVVDIDNIYPTLDLAQVINQHLTHLWQVLRQLERFQIGINKKNV
jgi:hypothetical protein